MARPLLALTKLSVDKKRAEHLFLRRRSLQHKCKLMQMQSVLELALGIRTEVKPGDAKSIGWPGSFISSPSQFGLLRVSKAGLASGFAKRKRERERDHLLAVVSF